MGGSEHGEAGSNKDGLEAGEEGGFPDCNGMTAGEGLASEGGGAGIDGVDVVPDGCWADASKGGEHPWEEEAVTCGRAGGVFGGFLFATCRDRATQPSLGRGAHAKMHAMH